MRNVVVTGANGFVGKAVVKILVEKRIHVYAVVRENAQCIEEYYGNDLIDVVYCNMSDYVNLQDKVKADKIDVFYHFAWNGSAGMLRNDEKAQLANVQYSCDALRSAKRMNCDKFIFAGSIMEYEVEVAMRSNQAPAISTIYSSAKKAADFICRALANELGITYICGLISNIYGPGEVSPRLVNTSIRKLLHHEHMSFSDGGQMYDFVYISDAAAVFYGLGESGKANKTYYIGSRNPKPLKEFLIELRDAVDPAQQLGLGELPFSGVSLTYKEFDIDAVYNDTGIEPKVSFSEGIKKTAEWITMEGK